VRGALPAQLAGDFDPLVPLEVVEFQQPFFLLGSPLLLLGLALLSEQAVGAGRLKLGGTAIFIICGLIRRLPLAALEEVLFVDQWEGFKAGWNVLLTSVSLFLQLALTLDLFPHSQILIIYCRFPFCNKTVSTWMVSPS
jgi:hypothetical protein